MRCTSPPLCVAVHASLQTVEHVKLELAYVWLCRSGFLKTVIYVFPFGDVLKKPEPVLHKGEKIYG